MTHAKPNQSRESLCVFQIGDTAFALAAAELREVTLRPPLAKVPNSNDVLAGLWHEGSEFLPVLRLPRQSPGESSGCEENMLVITGTQSTWGLLVDRVHGIELLELCTNDVDSGSDDWSTAQIGTSKLGEQVVRILNADGLYQLTEQILKESWAKA